MNVLVWNIREADELILIIYTHFEWQKSSESLDKQSQLHHTEFM